MRIVLLAFTSLFCLCTKAQLRIGGQVGYNHTYFSPRHFSTSHETYTMSPYMGFQVGAVTEARLAQNWFLRSGLILSGKGTRMRMERGFDSNSRYIELHYLEVPISFVYQWKVGKELIPFIGAGGYAARAVRGVEKGKGTSFSGRYDIYNKVEFRSENPENDGHPSIINPFDFGINLTAGVKRKNLQLLLTYSHGLQRVFPKSLYFEEKVSTRVLSLSAAYLFGIKK